MSFDLDRVRLAQILTVERITRAGLTTHKSREVVARFPRAIGGEYVIVHDRTMYAPLGVYRVSLGAREIGRQCSRPSVDDCEMMETIANNPDARRVTEVQYSYFRNADGDASKRGQRAFQTYCKSVHSEKTFTAENATRESRLALIIRAGGEPRIAKRLRLSQAAIHAWVKNGIPARHIRVVLELAAPAEAKAAERRRASPAVIA